jgi:competence protein ComFA
VKTGGKTIYLTATPDKKTLAKAKSGQGRLITIPARYHGHPVPEPRIMTVSAFNKNRAGRWTVEPIIMKLLENWLADEGRQVFIFLPTVRMVENFGPVLKESVENGLSGRTAGNDLLYYSHARDPLRDRKREGFKAGEFPFFLTTTIMERGITVKKANVLVLEADYEQVFDEGTLVQMAGRAGRSAEYPDGEVVFSGKRAGTAMKKAREQIMYLNRVAAKEGYLKGLWVGR